ncbi:MAG: hypothetical protein N2505_05920 [Endomicrobia bacterium]|nr:hypothetical protein [Endomicrobiia bacterium]
MYTKFHCEACNLYFERFGFVVKALCPLCETWISKIVGSPSQEECKSGNCKFGD